MFLYKNILLTRTLNVALFFLLLTCFYQLVAVLFNFELAYTYLIFSIVVFLAVIAIVIDFCFSRFRISKSHIIMVLFLLSLFFAVAAQYLFLDELFDYSGKSGHVHVKSFAVGGAAWFIVGAALGYHVYARENRKLSWLLVLLVFFMVSSVLNGSLVISYSELVSGRGYDFFVDHLIIGAFVTIILLLAIAYSHDYNIFLAIICFFIMFALGGRSDFLVILIAIFVVKIMYNKDRHKYMMMAVLGSVFFIFSEFYWSVLDTYSNESRMLKAFDFAHDESFAARIDLFTSAFDGLSEQFLFGNPNVLILRTSTNVELSNSLGALSHNILSIWQFYGFIPFCFCIYYLIITTYFISKNKSQLNLDPISKFGVLLFIFTSISILFSKSATYYPFWLSMGFWIVRVHQFSLKRDV